MAEKIEPALSAEEWAAYCVWKDAEHATDVPPLHIVTQDFSSAGEIAVHNDLLLDSDPRKITREMVATLREAADALPDVEDDAAATGQGEHYLGRALRGYADALESYLPPA